MMKKKVLKLIFGSMVLSLFLLANACNLPLQNQKRLTKKFSRNGVVEKTYTNVTDTIHYFEGGIGDTLVLIHGFGGDAQVTWFKTIQDLAKDYHIIAADLLWFGRSSSSRQPNLNAQVAALSQLLAEKKVNRYHIAGISYGGFVSLGLFYNNPAQVKSICIIDSPGVTYNLSLLDTLCLQEGVQSVDEIFVVENPAQVQKLFDLAFYKDRKIPKGVLENVYNLYFNLHHDELRTLLSTLVLDKAYFMDLSRPQFPKSLVIWGEEDAVFPLSEGRKLANFMDADFTVIPEAGHAVNIEQFASFQQIFRDFLRP